MLHCIALHCIASNRELAKMRPNAFFRILNKTLDESNGCELQKQSKSASSFMNSFFLHLNISKRNLIHP